MKERITTEGIDTELEESYYNDESRTKYESHGPNLNLKISKGLSEIQTLCEPSLTFILDTRSISCWRNFIRPCCSTSPAFEVQKQNERERTPIYRHFDPDFCSLDSREDSRNLPQICVS